MGAKQMKTTLKKYKTLFIVLIAVIGLVALFTVNYIRLNRLYPNPALETYRLGQPVSVDDFEITVKKFQMLDSDTLIQQYKIDDDDTINYLRRCPMKIILVTAAVKNNAKSKQGLSTVIELCNIQSFAFANGMDQDIFHIVNLKDSYKSQLKSGEETTVVLPFDLGEPGFKKEDWANINSRKFDLVVSTYPVKKSIHLN